MPPDRPRRMSRDEREAMLLAAAADVLRRRRDPLTFESIAEAAGVSPTLPYKYFESVDDVGLRLYRRVVQQIDDATDAVLADPDADFDAKLRGAIDPWFDAAKRHGVLLDRLTGADAPAGLQAFVARRRRRVTKLWAGEIEAAFQLPPTEAGLAAAAVIASTSALLGRSRSERLDRAETSGLILRTAHAICHAARPTAVVNPRRSNHATG